MRTQPPFSLSQSSKNHKEIHRSSVVREENGKIHVDGKTMVGMKTFAYSNDRGGYKQICHRDIDGTQTFAYSKDEGGYEQICHRDGASDLPSKLPRISFQFFLLLSLGLHIDRKFLVFHCFSWINRFDKRWEIEDRKTVNGFHKLTNYNTLLGLGSGGKENHEKSL